MAKVRDVFTDDLLFLYLDTAATRLSHLFRGGGEGSLECLGAGRFEGEVLARNGVVEVQAVGMESQSADGIVAVAVLDVTANGMTEVLHVHADLILTPRVEFELHERMRWTYAECTEMRARKLPAVVRG